MTSRLDRASMLFMNPDELMKLADTWLTALRTEGKSRHTVKQYGASVRAMTSWMKADEQDSMNLETAREFIVSIMDRGGASSTVNVRICAMRSFSSWLAAEGLAGADALAGLKSQKPRNKVVRDLSTVELTALLRAIRCQESFTACRDEAIVQFMSQTGGRADETLQMDVSDLGMQHRNATLRKAKGGKRRVVPLPPETAAAISLYLQVRRERGIPDTGPLWLSRRGGGRLSYDGLYSCLGRAAEEAGIEGFHPHRLRHTFVVRWLAAGGSEGGAMAICGWESRNMLDQYVGAAATELALAESRRICG